METAMFYDLPLEDVHPHFHIVLMGTQVNHDSVLEGTTQALEYQEGNIIESNPGN